MIDNPCYKWYFCNCTVSWQKLPQTLNSSHYICGVYVCKIETRGNTHRTIEQTSARHGLSWQNKRTINKLNIKSWSYLNIYFTFHYNTVCLVMRPGGLVNLVNTFWLDFDQPYRKNYNLIFVILLMAISLNLFLIKLIK